MNPPPSAKLPSLVLDWEKIPVRPTPVGARRELFDSPTATFANLEGHVTTLNPGEMPHPAHRHPDEEMILVKSGTVHVTINGRTSPAGAGSVIFFASNDEHGLRNPGPEVATYFVLRFLTAQTPAASA